MPTDLPTPAEALRTLREGKLTQDDLAEALGVSRFSVSQLENGRRGITPEMALLLAAATGTSEDYWLDLQRAVDLEAARRRVARKLPKIKRVL